MALKVSICVNYFHPSVGGAEFVSKTIADYISKHHEVSVFTRKLIGKRRDARDFPYRVYEYTTGDLVGFEKKLHDIKPDVVFIYSDVFDFFRTLATKRQPYQIILALCGANWLYGHRNYINMLYRNMKNIKAIVCHSTRERDYRMCATDIIKDKTVIIPNGIWLDEFDKNTKTRQDLAPSIADKRWLVNVSNFFPGKGQEHLINIFSQLPGLDQTAYVQISSDIDFDIGQMLEGRWKLMTRKLKKKGMKVKLMKNLPREDVIGFLKQSNVFTFSSEKEVAPLVLLESMAASLPWVSTNVGNAEDLKGGSCIRSVKDSRYHSVFDKRVELQFREAVLNMWNTPSFGDAGRQQIEDELTWDKILPQYLSLIEK